MKFIYIETLEKICKAVKDGTIESELTFDEKAVAFFTAQQIYDAAVKNSTDAQVIADELARRMAQR